jgi:hypothetical protein
MHKWSLTPFIRIDAVERAELVVERGLREAHEARLLEEDLGGDREELRGRGRAVGAEDRGPAPGDLPLQLRESLSQHPRPALAGLA